MATTTSHHSLSLAPSSATPLHDVPRHRQHYPQPTTPNDPYQYPQDIKDTQHVNPAYDQQSYHPNGPSYRSRSPLSHHSPLHYDRDTTLSTFLSNLFLTAKHQLQQHPITSTTSATPLSTVTSLLPTLPTDPQELKASAGFILLCALWYLSSAFSSNTGKSIMTQFRYPVTLTFVQFAFVAGYCVVFLAARERFSGLGGPQLMPGQAGRRGSIGTASGWGIKKPTKAMFQGTLMMSLFQIAGHVFSSMAIARVPVSTVHTIKALSPLFTVVSYALLFGVRYGTPTYLALLPLTLGVMLACSFDLRANAIGFLCALGSTVIFVSQNIFSKKLLPKESSAGQAAPTAAGGSGGGKLDKLNLLFYSSGMAFFLMIPIWLYSDASTLLSAWLNPISTPTPSSSSSSGSLALSFFLNGTVHFAQNLLAFSILARTSPVTYSIASLVKRIAVICIAIIWSGQKVSLVQGFGMTMTFVGLWLYNRAKGDVDKGERKRGAVEKRQEMFLPTTADDVRQMQATPPPPLPPHHHHQQPPPPQPFSPTYAPTPNYVPDLAGAGQSQPRNRSLTSSQPVFSHGAAAGHVHPPPPPPPPSSGLSQAVKAR